MYRGRGPEAEARATRLEVGRERRAEEHRERRAEEVRQRDLDQLLADVLASVEETLGAEGFYRHRRSLTWRAGRMGKGTVAAKPDEGKEVAFHWGLDMQSAITVAERLIPGDGDRRAEIRKDFVKVVSDKAKELAGPLPSPEVESLAVVAALAWADHGDALERARGTYKNGLTTNQAEHLDRRLDRANRRYLRSIRALAGVKAIEARRPKSGAELFGRDFLKIGTGVPGRPQLEGR